MTNVVPIDRSASAGATSEDGALLGLVFQLIAGIYRSPSDALRADIDSGALRAALEAVADATGIEAPELPTPGWPALQSTHVDLFVSSPSGVAAPPYVGFAIDDEVMGPSAQLLGAAFADYGIELQDTWRDLPDHLAAVAEGGALLVRSGRSDAARALLAGFVAPWFERYTDAVAKRDTSAFYGPVTHFLRRTIEEVTRESRS
ncbi:MAG: molecular chaperone TorD family protein [Trueperaceae bacterium]